MQQMTQELRGLPFAKSLLGKVARNESHHWARQSWRDFQPQCRMQDTRLERKIDSRPMLFHVVSGDT